MKRVFTFISMFSCALVISAQEFVPFLIDDDTISIQHAAIEALDVNLDGAIDVVISGDGLGVVAAGIFLSGGDKTFTLAPVTNVITPGFLACMDAGDINADGYLDFIFNGWLPGASTTTNGIALDTGTPDGYVLSDAYEIGDVAPTSGFADLNNDALLDYFFFGNGQGACAIYFQNQDGTFTKDNTSFASFNFVDPQVTIIDFNNDGYMDMFINGWENNQGNRFSKMFINDMFGGLNVSEQPNIIQKGYGTAVWFDVNADGHLDLLLNGDGGADGEASSDIYRLYKNNNGVLEEAATFNDYRQISVGGGSRFADLDNDGDADIIITGWSVTENRQVTNIYECTDAANFTYARHTWSDSPNVPGVSESEIEVADFNNDHKIDIVISGFSGNFGRRVAGVIFNDMEKANTRPEPPQNLSIDDIEGGGVMFSWDAGSDAETPVGSLTYSLYLKDVTNDRRLFNPGTDQDGKRGVTGMGNLDNSLEWPIYELPDGDYEWSVQTVDGSYEGSTYPGPLQFTLQDGVISGTGSSFIDQKDPLADLSVIHNELHVKFHAGVDQGVVRIFTLDGKEVLTARPETTDYTVSLDNGFYLIHLSSGEKTQTEKLVVF
ncbi:MAG: T9SS type A sorting domain-containing protein [Bacteroidales bacterium]|nr:T9SS type A sorting domain-containing protein [Bacteroidales bacterium]MBN2698899.1 T9SS type A sorting domain-containing protein [Bacteroidales bacterium]